MSEIFLHSEKILLVFNAQVLGRKAITWVITFHLKNLRSSWRVVMMRLRLNLPRSQQRGQESRLITLGTDFYLKWAGKKVITLFFNLNLIILCLVLSLYKTLSVVTKTRGGGTTSTTSLYFPDLHGEAFFTQGNKNVVRLFMFSMSISWSMTFFFHFFGVSCVHNCYYAFKCSVLRAWSGSLLQVWLYSFSVHFF